MNVRFFNILKKCTIIKPFLYNVRKSYSAKPFVFFSLGIHFILKELVTKNDFVNLKKKLTTWNSWSCRKVKVGVLTDKEKTGELWWFLIDNENFMYNNCDLFFTLKGNLKKVYNFCKKCILWKDFYTIFIYDFDLYKKDYL